MDQAPVPGTTARARPRRAAGLCYAAAASVLFAGLALLLGACGSSGGNSAAALSSSPSSGGTGPVAFAQCMRSHGVTDFPDPQGGRFLMSGTVQRNPNFQSAVQACQHMLGPGGIGGGDNGARSSRLLAFAHCMQTHGVPNFPDPSPNGAIRLPQGVDRNSASFQAAQRACRSKAPGLGTTP